LEYWSDGVLSNTNKVSVFRCQQRHRRSRINQIRNFGEVSYKVSGEGCVGLTSTDWLTVAGFLKAQWLSSGIIRRIHLQGKVV
jgi:hypothetical protein